MNRTVNMDEQERLVKEIKSLSDSIRRKNRALRLGISERDKYLETTFKPVVGPLKEMVQTVKKFIPPTEGDLVLPVSEFKNEEDYDDDEVTESQESDISEAVGEKGEKSIVEEVKTSEEEEDKEGETPNPSNISVLGKDISSIGIIGRKYILKMMHSAPANKRYHVYGARLEGDGLKIGNTSLNLDKENNIWIGDKKYKGSIGLYELIFNPKPANYSKRDLVRFKEICKITNAHKKGYAANAPIHKNTSAKYKNIISELFQNRSVRLKRRAMSAAELNLLHKKRKTVSGDGILKNTYSTNVIYYNNVNKLVTRMRLIHEAIEAGHTGLENEWVALTTELRNRGVIE